jgi:pimeloyl-ACP methyl ester carboxylesterase
VPVAVLGGLATSYQVAGSGPPLLMFSPGGFNAVASNWTSFSLYGRLGLLDHLTRAYTCVTFDRRESGASGGRVERITWRHYAAQGRALLDHLGLGPAHLMGGCVGCSVALTFAAEYPDSTRSLVLYSPAGGPRYRIRQHERFARHLAYTSEHGPAGVAELARGTGAGFTEDPRVGPWAPVIRTDTSFARDFGALDPSRYAALVAGTGRTLFDRDTVPGPEPEDLFSLNNVPSLIVPGQDSSHAPSAARYLQECLPAAQYWDTPVPDQTEATAPPRVLEFLSTVT